MFPPFVYAVYLVLWFSLATLLRGLPDFALTVESLGRYMREPENTSTQRHLVLGESNDKYRGKYRQAFKVSRGERPEISLHQLQLFVVQGDCLRTHGGGL